ncbi:hypothetical protein L4D15_16705 [Enterovibrio norvegicus]|uniref:hypothetical protein n=1 Tax=Enterovibrio norvegicus TaxID=188144 RepID=UPI003D14D273
MRRVPISLLLLFTVICLFYVGYIVASCESQLLESKESSQQLWTSLCDSHLKNYPTGFAALIGVFLSTYLAFLYAGIKQKNDDIKRDIEKNRQAAFRALIEIYESYIEMYQIKNSISLQLGKSYDITRSLYQGYSTSFNPKEVSFIPEELIFLSDYQFKDPEVKKRGEKLVYNIVDRKILYRNIMDNYKIRNELSLEVLSFIQTLPVKDDGTLWLYTENDNHRNTLIQYMYLSEYSYTSVFENIDIITELYNALYDVTETYLKEVCNNTFLFSRNIHLPMMHRLDFNRFTFDDNDFIPFDTEAIKDDIVNRLNSDTISYLNHQKQKSEESST